MNNNDIYNDENIHTNDSVNINKELISYTKNEISHEMDILSRSFDSVRLVNPFECCVTQIEDNKTDGTSLTNKCYDVWNAPYQCQNCTSARALITKQTQSKLDIVDNKIYQVTSRPVIFDAKSLFIALLTVIFYRIKKPIPITGIIFLNIFLTLYAKQRKTTDQTQRLSTSGIYMT